VQNTETVKVKPLIGIYERYRGVNMSCENNGLIERLLKCEEDLDNRKDDLQTWTDALEVLSEIEDAFEPDERNKLHGKTILDIGTDCVKPLFIALKFEPDKIIGISEDLSVYSFASDLEQKSKLFTEKTKIRLYNCNLFDKVTLDRIKEKEGIGKGKFDFVLVSKTLHHLRTGKCVANRRNEEHEHREDEECCIYGFEEQKIFETLLELGKRVIVYECFCPHEKDDDKVRGRGGYFTTKEWKETFENLLERYRVEFIRPQQQFHLNKETLNKVDLILKQVDCVCFYVEEQSGDEKNSQKAKQAKASR
jgi:hypothetical protein